ncbi:ribosomal L29 protein-domain-containing protein [Zopfochytrium polystomum]|nr:ribosomal L29 protein-domain-containing protein [Zopfochytrium polystomum]
MAKIRAYELRTKSKADLAKQLEELKKELSSLRVQKATNANNAKVARIANVRKSIARVQTVISQTQRDQLRLYYKGAKKTVRTIKRETHFPPRRWV